VTSDRTCGLRGHVRLDLWRNFFFSSLPSPYHYTDECSDPTTTADPVLLAVRACTALRLALPLRADEALEGGGEA
jgi:hypothetical protein